MKSGFGIPERWNGNGIVHPIPDRFAQYRTKIAKCDDFEANFDDDHIDGIDQYEALFQDKPELTPR